MEVPARRARSSRKTSFTGRMELVRAEVRRGARRRFYGLLPAQDPPSEGGPAQLRRAEASHTRGVHVVE